MIKKGGKQENREPSRNTPPQAKLSETFKSKKLGVSSQKKPISRVNKWQ